ncbi:hypothetical protein RGQ29_023334 [Quercus rubra]|uniref:Early nodulin-75-like n=1 Tax=Quercus rubra TaxID=3512 RepID=A0AAN7IU47_QUERU|nr:hypothetical protein RGQ29_023334 [Quercus rubra]
MTTTKYCLVLLLGVVILSTASLADHHESPKHKHKPPKGEKPPPKHKPPTALNKEEKPLPEHKPPTPGKGEKPPSHDHHPGRLLLESASIDGKPPPKGEKPPPKHKPPTPLDKEEKSFPEHKPPKGKGEKPPPEHKPPHDHHPRHLLLESSSIDGKAPPKGEKPQPKHKPPTSVEEGEKKPFQNTSHQNVKERSHHMIITQKIIKTRKGHPERT